MTPDFEKQMRDKLADASPGDLLDDFDTAGTWQQIEQRIAPVTEKKRPWMWVTHAAAVAAGVVLALVFLNRQQQSADSGLVAVKDTMEQVRPVAVVNPVATLPDTAVSQPAVPKTIYIYRQQKTNVVPQAPVLVAVPDKQMPLAADSVKNGTDPRQLAVAPIKTGIVHILDMNNEDRNLAQNEAPVALGGSVIEVNKPGTNSKNTPLAVSGLIKSFASNK